MDLASPYTFRAERYVDVARFVFWASIWSHGAIGLVAGAVGEWGLCVYFLAVTGLYALLARMRTLPEVIVGTWLAFGEVSLVTWLLVHRYDGGLGALSLLLFLDAALFFVPVSPRVKAGVLGALTAYGAALVVGYGVIEGSFMHELVEWGALAVTVAFLAGLAAYYNQVVDEAEEGLRAEHAKSEALLHNTLPAAIVPRLKAGPAVLADEIPEATVLFADIVGFTPLAARTSPERLLVLLDDLFRRFDREVEAAGMEKIKTIGDAYMAAAGVPEPCADHAARGCALALAMVEALADFNADRALDPPLALRVGLHAGPLVAGVIGEKRFAYDLWGDTVNTAARMESHGESGRVQVSEAVVDAVGEAFAFEARGEVAVKGKGTMRTAFLVGRA